MSHPDWDKIDQIHETFPLYDCAFLDILGYKERVGSFFDNKFNLFGRIERALEAVKLTGTIAGFMVDLSKFSVEIISDSIILTEPATPHGPARVILFSGLFMSALGTEGLFLRGGIARGRHFQRRTKQGFQFLASEAYQKAYELESKRAIYPRVLVEPSLVAPVVKEVNDSIVHDGSDYFVHFGNWIINREGDNFSNVYAEMDELFDHMNKLTEPRIKEKYRWLLDYYYWTIKVNPKWDIKKFSKFAGIDRGFSFAV